MCSWLPLAGGEGAANLAVPRKRFIFFDTVCYILKTQ
jgi:hypothetical protein